jgi:hypothetical protein
MNVFVYSGDAIFPAMYELNRYYVEEAFLSEF